MMTSYVYDYLRLSIESKESEFRIEVIFYDFAVYVTQIVNYYNYLHNTFT